MKANSGSEGGGHKARLGELTAKVADLIFRPSSGTHFRRQATFSFTAMGERAALRLIAEPAFAPGGLQAMIRYKEIAFTAYAVTNMARARKFYEGVLGLKVSRKFSKVFYEYDIGPGTLVVACNPKRWPPSRKGTAVALEVVDFDEAVAHLKKKKVPLAIPVQDVPTCRMLGVRDPDGNLITLHQRKRRPAGKKPSPGPR
jgi:catechol 2,3-dioxygenase-like lactoylglutathione lyase family enzyme